MARVYRDKYENFFIILNALESAPNGELSSFKMATKLYGAHATKATTRTEYFLMKLYAIDAIKGYETDVAKYWKIEPKGRTLLGLYRRMLRLFPEEFKGQDIKDLELKHKQLLLNELVHQRSGTEIIA